uniref:Uncharacterized protein n=1 Tax=Ditylenchus dipsaci TaxID=166011 RepID=A0A915CY85_9BILA
MLAFRFLTNNQGYLKWGDVDILAPPDLNNTILEAMRMNELLAHPQYTQCAQKLLVGGIRDSFHLCADAKFRTKGSAFGKCLLISGRTESKGQFERAVNNSRWAVFLPQSNPILIDGMQSDVEIHYMSELEEYKYFPVEKIVEAIRDETEEFALAKLEASSAVFSLLDATQLQKAPERLKQILQHLRAKQLLVIVQVEPETATQSNLACGLDLQYFGHCEYRVSFVKTDLFEVDTAPVFGLGSPWKRNYVY